MSEAFDIYTILFLVLAVVIFIRLRNVLGRRTGSERPPYDPYSSSEAKPPNALDWALNRARHIGTVLALLSGSRWQIPGRTPYP